MFFVRNSSVLRAAALICALADLAACTSAPVKLVEPAPPGTETIAILATNDLHGALLPPGDDSTETGGAPLLAGFVRALKKEWGRNLLWLDAGDALSGSFESSVDGGAAMVAFLNQAGLDATALGDRDLDLGPELLGQRIQESRFSWLASNVGAPGGVLPSRVFRVGGLSVGVVGVTIAGLESARGRPFRQKAEFQPISEALARESRKLRESGAQIVVALAHAGIACEPTGGPSQPPIRKPDDPQGRCDRSSELGRALARLPSGTVDAVVSGDSHRQLHHWVPTSLGSPSVPVVEGGSQGHFFNVIYLSYDWNRGQLVRERARIEGPVAVTRRSFHGRSVGPEKQAADLVDALEQRLKAPHDELVAVAARPLGHSKLVESELGNLAADAVREAARADVALVNPGSLRAGLPSGSIRAGDLHAAIPYNPKIVTVEVTGQELALLARIASNGSRGLFQFSGLRLRLLEREADAQATDLDGDRRIELWEVNRLIETRLSDGSTLQPAKTYRLATLDFLALGGDDFSWFFSQLPDSRFSAARGAPGLRDAVRSRLVALWKTSSSSGGVNSLSSPLLEPGEPRYRFEKKKPGSGKQKRRRGRRARRS